MGIDRGVTRRGAIARAAAASGAGAGGFAHAAAGVSRSAGFAALLSGFADRLLARSPTTATRLGSDTGRNAYLRNRLENVSQAGREEASAAVKQMLRDLERFGRGDLAPERVQLFDSVRYFLKAAETAGGFAYGRGVEDVIWAESRPYMISQRSSALINVPEILDSKHQVVSAADGESYLARVAALPVLLDQETERLREDAAKGVAPPAFVAAAALEQMRAFRALPATEQTLAKSLARRAREAGLDGDWSGRCRALIDSRLYPAVDRQIAAFERVTRNAPQTAGVHRLPDGEAYYAAALRTSTTTTLAPAEIHRMGIEQNAEIKARIDAILRSQGMSQGSVGERLQALNRDPRFLFPEGDAGRKQAIAFVQRRIDIARALMPLLSHLQLKAPIDLKRMPEALEAGGSFGWLDFAALDGSRPALFYVNLQAVDQQPTYQLPTLAAHEGLPGHGWQGAYLAEHPDEISPIQPIMTFTAFVEGWGLYAEQLADEVGLYDDDPFGRIGYLQSRQRRACRLVMDTGLHWKRWTRDQAVDFMHAETGVGRGACTAETDRYCVAPGQACSYKIGQNQIVALREQTRTRLGARFDLAAFNDAVVRSGGVPLDLLPGVVARLA